MGGGRNCQSLGRVHLKDLHTPRTNTNPANLGTTSRTAARGAPVTYGKGDEVTGNLVGGTNLSGIVPSPSHIQSH